MRATTRLLKGCRITLFTRENCGLCTDARSVLSNVWDQRNFAYEEIDIIKDTTKQSWRDLYEFDTPVIHVAKETSPPEQPQTASRAIKLMHRFTEEQVKDKMDAAEKN